MYRYRDGPDGETVIGASVVVKGTTNGTISGLDGDFSIPSVKKGDVIIITYVGYVSQEIVWDGKPMKVILKEDSKTLDEVVDSRLRYHIETKNYFCCISGQSR